MKAIQTLTIELQINKTTLVKFNWSYNRNTCKGMDQLSMTCAFIVCKSILKISKSRICWRRRKRMMPTRMMSKDKEAQKYEWMKGNRGTTRFTSLTNNRAK